MRKKMRFLLILLCALCATPGHGMFEGSCLRKDPPPGVLVVSAGSKLVLTCSGHVKVDGVKVTVTGDSSNTKSGASSSERAQTIIKRQDSIVNHIVNHTGVLKKRDKDHVDGKVIEHTLPMVVSKVTGEDGEARTTSESTAGWTSRGGYLDTGHKTSPTAQTFQPTSVSRQRESSWEEVGDEGDYEEEEAEEEEGSRVTRGLKNRPQWKFNGMTMRKGERDWGGLTFGRSESTLSLPSVRLTDSGKYTCQHRDKTFSLRVIVAGPPEHPSLSCYKKSPSSKIRCEWTPQQPTTVRPHCYLFLSKSLPWTFSRSQCSFSSRLSRCWCTLDHNEDEKRIRHTAYLCVTSSVGNATSSLLHFTPLNILRPDPPSDVRVQQEECQEKRITVTWNFPASWKPQDGYYQLMYELSYRPIKSEGLHGQTATFKSRRSYVISDALPGAEYMIQLRTKEEYDGLWSNWSAPVYACSWTAQHSTSVLSDDLAPTMDPFSVEGSGTEDSGTDDNRISVPESKRGAVEVWYHVLWISASCVLLSVILAAYIFRHKARFVSKLQILSEVSRCGDPSRPSASPPAAPEGQALVTFAPPHYKQPLPNEVEEEEDEKEEELRVEESGEAMHFNNTSYFLVKREC